LRFETSITYVKNLTASMRREMSKQYAAIARPPFPELAVAGPLKKAYRNNANVRKFGGQREQEHCRFCE
jgi:hypothetical protein